MCYKGRSMESIEKGKRLKVILAVVLIILGVGALLFWELWGREYVTYESVVVAKDVIQPGTVITEGLLKEKSFTKDTVISGALKWGDIEKIEGMKAKQLIAEGAQIHSAYLSKPEKYINEGESIFKLPAEWIDMRSSSIRRGDVIEIYGEDGISIGIFKVAFVKDVQEREVTAIDNKEHETLDRIEATGVINSIEIITTLEKYNLIKSRAFNVETNQGEKFTVVQIINN